MRIDFGTVPLGAVLPVHFGSYDGATGASEAISGLAVTDIEIYKAGTVTQRASDAGYALIDTDGIDIDGIVGANGFTIDTGDNTDAGFYAPGSYYNVWVSSITADTQTVNFLAATFRISPTEITGTLSGTHSTTTADLGTNAPSYDIAGMMLKINGFPSRLVDSYNTGTGVATFSPALSGAPSNGDVWTLMATPPASTGAPIPSDVTKWNGTAVGTPATNGYPVVTLKVGTGTGEVNVASGKTPSTIAAGDLANSSITAAAIATGAIDADALATDAANEIADALLDRSNGIETGYTPRQVLRLMASVLLAKASGLGTATAVYRDLPDTKDRVTGTVDADGNRTAVTHDAT